MRKLLFIAAIFLFTKGVDAQDFQEIGPKIKQVAQADAHFSNIKKGEKVNHSLDLGTVKVSEGTVHFTDAECSVISPNNKTPEWMYIVDFNPKEKQEVRQDLRKATLLVFKALKEEGYTVVSRNEKNAVLMSANEDLASIMLNIEDRGGQAALVIYVSQPTTYAGNEEMELFSSVKGKYRLQTDFGGAYIYDKTGQNEYAGNYDKIKALVYIRFRGDKIIVRRDAMQASYKVENGKLYLTIATGDEKILDKAEANKQKKRGASFSSPLEAHKKVFQLYTQLYHDRYADVIRELPEKMGVGESCRLYNSGLIYHGTYKKFTPHGKGKYYYLGDGHQYRTYEGEVVDGKRTGLQVMEIVDAELGKTARAEGVRMVDGKTDGKVVFMHQGKPFYEIVYNKGKILSNKKYEQETAEPINKPLDTEKTKPKKKHRLDKIGRNDEKHLYFVGKFMIDFIGLRADNKNVKRVRQKHSMKTYDDLYLKWIYTQGIRLSFIADDYNNTYLSHIDISDNVPSVSYPFGLKIGQTEKETEIFQKNYAQYPHAAFKNAQGHKVVAIDVNEKEAVVTYTFDGSGKIKQIDIFDFDFFQERQPNMAKKLLEERQQFAPPKETVSPPVEKPQPKPQPKPKPKSQPKPQPTNSWSHKALPFSGDDIMDLLGLPIEDARVQRMLSYGTFKENTRDNFRDGVKRMIYMHENVSLYFYQDKNYNYHFEAVGYMDQTRVGGKNDNRFEMPLGIAFGDSMNRLNNLDYVLSWKDETYNRKEAQLGAGKKVVVTFDKDPQLPDAKVKTVYMETKAKP